MYYMKTSNDFMKLTIQNKRVILLNNMIKKKFIK